MTMLRSKPTKTSAAIGVAQPLESVVTREHDIAWRGQNVKLRAHGRTSVPQIFIGDRHVGGSDDLHEPSRTAGSDPLLNGE